MQKGKQENNYFKYEGAIHIHSSYSDGSGDVYSIAKAARAAGLRWIIITDHNNMNIEEGIINEVCVIKGNEISPIGNKNHYITLNTNNVTYDQEPQNFVEAVRKEGGFGFAAHPFESEKRKNLYRPIRWDCSVIPDGIEIWNWFSQWGNKYNEQNIFGIIYSYLFRHKLVGGAEIESLKWWDKLNNIKETIVPAIGGLDVHAMKINKYFIPVTIFHYKEMFGTITNVLLLKEPLSKDFETHKKQIFSALKNGNNFITNRRIQKEIPEISIENEYGKITCGETLKFACNTYLHIKQSNNCYAKIVRNGAEYKLLYGKDIKYKLEKSGKYRVELSTKRKTFAYSNPLNLTEVGE